VFFTNILYKKNQYEGENKPQKHPHQLSSIIRNQYSFIFPVTPLAFWYKKTVPSSIMTIAVGYLIIILVICLLLFSHMYLHYMFSKKYKIGCGIDHNNNVKALVNQLQDGDVVFICSKKPPFSSTVELLGRPIVHAIFNTCYMHPVYISRDPGTGGLSVFHWTGTNYSAKHVNICPDQHVPRPAINIGNAHVFFESHAKSHGPIVTYKIYRNSSFIPLPQQMVVALGKQKCGIPAGLTRNSLQCFYFMLLLLQKIGYFDSKLDVFHHATPARAEQFLRRNGFELVNEVTVCGSYPKNVKEQTVAYP
jgi:hypothetical protein